jgi:hypothetical protein
MSNRILLRTKVILPAVLGGMAGAVGGVLAVVALGTLAWEVVRGMSGLAIGVIVGAATGIAVCEAISKGNAPRLWPVGGLAGILGGGIGAFCTIASAELWQGMDWAVYGGLYGAFTGAFVGAVTSALTASLIHALRVAGRVGKGHHA